MTELTLSPGETRQVVFVLGQADDLAEVHRLIHEYAQRDGADVLLAEVQQQWDRLLNALQVATPDLGIDLMRQSLACLPGPGLPRLGPLRRFTNPAERTGFAINCRM